MIVKEITSNQSESVLFDSEIAERIEMPDNRPELPTDNVDYIGGFVKGFLFGVVIFIYRNGFTTCHINVLKKYRAKYSVSFAKKALKLRKSKIVYTNIPEKFKDVARFAKFFGFDLVKKMKNENIYRLG